jgi:predicted TIM-barrel fold metal-dependent hydrolase
MGERKPYVAPDDDKQKKPIINCHTHIFTGDHVAPFLGKSLIPGPFSFLLNFKWVFSFFRWWFGKGPGKKKYGGKANERKAWKYKIKMFVQRNFFLKLLLVIIGLFLTLQAVDFFYHWILPAQQKTGSWLFKQIYTFHAWLYDNNILFETKNIWLQLFLILIVMVLFKSGRNLLLFIVKNIVSLLVKMPGKETKALINRYISIGRYTFHREQETTLRQLKNQYPGDSGFVILPMDMEYMDAGKVPEPYRMQMEKLAKLKENAENNIYPFVFVDPRRIAAEPDYFRFSYINNKVVLEDCFIKEYIEVKKFSGFKIYPALGYYPFDPLLLPLWKYAEQNQIPILTHCVRGPMYYRGSKKPDWDKHPVFKQTTTTGVDVQLLLPETRNDAFTANFTHPMNFLCLLEKEWLRKIVNQAYQKTKDERLKDIFGLIPSADDDQATIINGLENLKICIGHYGGNDEWKRYFELDRLSYSNELAQNPFEGIDFLYKKNSNELSPGKPEQLWKYTDWYSIICSMMLQHPNVYADISYILHNDAQILPLLKQTLQNHELRKKILYGTDFYVVRNQKSDKNMLADMMGGLSVEDFDVIARENPKKFLNII